MREPRLRIVATNSERDLARREAADAVEWTLRLLAANLMRVIRGAGKPREIGDQCTQLVQRLHGYRELCGHLPSSFELRSALTLEKDESFLEECDEDSLTWYYADQQIVRGALQKAASQLLGQQGQGRSGDIEMYEGIRTSEGVRKRDLKRYQDSALRSSRPSVDTVEWTSFSKAGENDRHRPALLTQLAMIEPDAQSPPLNAP